MGFKRMAALAVVLSLSAGLLFGCGGAQSTAGTDNKAQASSSSKQPIKLGAVFILSGPSAAYGIAQKAGVELAVTEINAGGGINGRPLDVIYEDSKGDKDQAINAARKLIDKDEVTAIIGPTLSTEMQAVGPIANQSGVPILGVSTTADGITDIGNYVFRNSLPESGVLPTTVQSAIQGFGVKKVALLWAQDDVISVNGAKIFKEQLQKQNVQVVAEDSFSVKDQDFNAQITKALAAKPDGIVLSTLYQSAALFMVQARKAGYTGPFIGGNGFNSPKLAEIAKDAAEGAVVGSVWYPGRDDAKVKKFVADYTAKANMAPDQFAAQAYDGLYLLAEAMKQGGSNRDKVRDALAGIKNFEGVTGKFSFDEKRNPVMQPFILQIKNGQYAEFKH
ncbi:MAG: ABC transporter substrate-binding protein [Mycobacterium leprae]